VGSRPDGLRRVTVDCTRAEEANDGWSCFSAQGDIVGIKPPVWRRVLVASVVVHPVGSPQRPAGSLSAGTTAILHEFEIDGSRYGTEREGAWGRRASKRASDPPRQVAREGTTMRYVYDFGDDWVHKVVVEKEVAG